MTIYKFPAGEKKPEGGVDAKDILKVPLTYNEPEDKQTKAFYILVRNRRSRTCLNLCLIFMALLVLAAGTVGGVYLYRHLAHKRTSLVCGVNGHDPDLLPKEGEAQSYTYFEEKIEVTDEVFEKIEVPATNYWKYTVVLHDFVSNYTAIVDEVRGRCFVMHLNRTLVKYPRNMMDLLWKYHTRYYIPNVRILHEKYHVVTPPVSDPRQFGRFVISECYAYDIYRLEPIAGHGIHKRAAAEPSQYAYCSDPEVMVNVQIYE